MAFERDRKTVLLRAQSRGAACFIVKFPVVIKIEGIERRLPRRGDEGRECVILPFDGKRAEDSQSQEVLL
jgi:hypothetical protein